MKNDSFNSKAILEELVKKRFKLNDRETRQIAENILEVEDQITSGEKAERIMKNVAKFLDDFANDLSLFEKRRQKKKKSASSQKKKKSQLDFFPTKVKA